MEKISIIIPVYNGADTIEKCITSLLNQTVSIHEIIVVDDGSTDETPQILSTLSEANSYVKIITLRNQGVSNARNVALSHATGDLIGFADADDFAEPNMYELLSDSIINNNSDCSVCGFFTEKEGISTPVTYGLNGTLSSNDFLNALFINDSVGGFIWNRLFRRNLLSDADAFDVSFSVCEDKLYQLGLALRKNIKVSIVDRALYHYVQSGSSATSGIHYFKSGSFVYRNVFSKMKIMIEDACNVSGIDGETLMKSLHSNYRSILEYSMYCLLKSESPSKKEIRLLKAEMKRVQSEVLADTSISKGARRHYQLLSNIPLIYRALRL